MLLLQQMATALPNLGGLSLRVHEEVPTEAPKRKAEEMSDAPGPSDPARRVTLTLRGEASQAPERNRAVVRGVKGLAEALNATGTVAGPLGPVDAATGVHIRMDYLKRLFFTAEDDAEREQLLKDAVAEGMLTLLASSTTNQWGLDVQLLVLVLITQVLRVLHVPGHTEGLVALVVPLELWAERASTVDDERLNAAQNALGGLHVILFDQATEEQRTSFFKTLIERRAFATIAQALELVWSANANEHNVGAMAVMFFSAAFSKLSDADDMVAVLSNTSPTPIARYVATKLHFAVVNSSDWPFPSGEGSRVQRSSVTTLLLVMAKTILAVGKQMPDMLAQLLEGDLVNDMVQAVMHYKRTGTALIDGDASESPKSEMLLALECLKMTADHGYVIDLWTRGPLTQRPWALQLLDGLVDDTLTSNDAVSICQSIYTHGMGEWKQEILDAFAAKFKRAAEQLVPRTVAGTTNRSGEVTQPQGAGLAVAGWMEALMKRCNDDASRTDVKRTARALANQDALSMLTRTLDVYGAGVARNGLAAMHLLSVMIAHVGDAARALAMSRDLVVQPIIRYLSSVNKRFAPSRGFLEANLENTRPTLATGANNSTRLLRVLTTGKSLAAKKCREYLVGKKTPEREGAMQCVIDMAVGAYDNRVRFKANRQDAVGVLCNLLRSGNMLHVRWWERVPNRAHAEGRVAWQSAVAYALTESTMLPAIDEPFFRMCIQGMRDYAERGFNTAQEMVSQSTGGVAHIVLIETMYASLANLAHDDQTRMRWLDINDSMRSRSIHAKHVVGTRTFAPAAHALAALLAAGTADRINIGFRERSAHTAVRAFLRVIRDNDTDPIEADVDPNRILLAAVSNVQLSVSDRMAALVLGCELSDHNPARMPSEAWMAASKALMTELAGTFASLPAMEAPGGEDATASPMVLDADLSTDYESTDYEEDVDMIPAPAPVATRMGIWRALMEHHYLFTKEYGVQEMQQKVIEMADAYLLIDLMRDGSSTQRFNAISVLHMSAKRDGFLFESYLTRGGLKQLLDTLSNDALAPSGAISGHASGQTSRRLYLLTSLLRYIARSDDNRTPFPIFRNVSDNGATPVLTRLMRKVWKDLGIGAELLSEWEDRMRMMTLEAMVEILWRLLQRNDGDLIDLLMDPAYPGHSDCNASDLLIRALTERRRNICTQAAEALHWLQKERRNKTNNLAADTEARIDSSIIAHADTLVRISKADPADKRFAGDVGKRAMDALKILLDHVKMNGRKSNDGEWELMEQDNLEAFVAGLNDTRRYMRLVNPSERTREWYEQERFLSEVWLALLKYGEGFLGSNDEDIQVITGGWSYEDVRLTECIQSLNDPELASQDRLLAVKLLDAFVGHKRLGITDWADMQGATEELWTLVKDDGAPADARATAVHALRSMFANARGDLDKPAAYASLAVKIIGEGDLDTWTDYLDLRRAMLTNDCSKLQDALTNTMHNVRRLFASHPSFYDELDEALKGTDPQNCYATFSTETRIIVTSMLDNPGYQKAAALAPNGPSFKAALGLAKNLDRTSGNLVADLQIMLGTGNGPGSNLPASTYDLTRRVLEQNLGNYDALASSARARAKAVLAANADGDAAEPRSVAIKDDDEPDIAHTPEGFLLLPELVSQSEQAAMKNVQAVLRAIKTGTKTMRGIIDLVNRLRAAHFDPAENEAEDTRDEQGLLTDRVRFRKILRHVEETVNDRGGPFYLDHMNQMQKSAKGLPASMFTPA